MGKKFEIADVKKFFKEKYSLLSSNEIAQLMKTKENSSWDEWYEALQSYADGLGNDWERSAITDCGEECWREAYDSGDDVKTAFIEGFTEQRLTTASTRLASSRVKQMLCGHSAIYRATRLCRHVA